jgi:hypothetical protein
MLALDAAVGRLPGPAARALRPRVDQLLEGLREQALALAGRGGELPAHEVSYEQSIVARWSPCCRWPTAADPTRGCCAFLYPSCVDGVPAHGPDPLDNDQDWALVYALRSGLVP